MQDKIYQLPVVWRRLTKTTTKRNWWPYFCFVIPTVKPYLVKFAYGWRWDSRALNEPDTSSWDTGMGGISGWSVVQGTRWKMLGLVAMMRFWKYQILSISYQRYRLLPSSLISLSLRLVTIRMTLHMRLKCLLPCSYLRWFGFHINLPASHISVAKEIAT